MVCACVCICLSEWYVRVYVYVSLNGMCVCMYMHMAVLMSYSLPLPSYTCKNKNTFAGQMTVEQVQALLDTGPTYTRCVQGVCHETLRVASRMQVKRNILHVSLENKYATDKKPQTRTKDHRHGRKTTECLHLTQKCLHRLRSLACVLKDDKILCSALSLARSLFPTL